MTATITRLSKADRRSQLLDVAADLVLTSGSASVTMERLAERAGVSKALAYLHFDNSAAVLAELYRREVTQLGIEILVAIERPETPEMKLRAAVRTYLDVVRERGAIFTLPAPSNGLKVPGTRRWARTAGRKAPGSTLTVAVTR